MSAANPERGADGAWRDNEGGVLIMLRLRRDVKERFDGILVEELSALEEINEVSAGDSLSVGDVLTTSARL